VEHFFERHWRIRAFLQWVLGVHSMANPQNTLPDILRAYRKCFSYTVRHKWFVFVAAVRMIRSQNEICYLRRPDDIVGRRGFGWRLSLQLLVRAIYHDIDKFGPRMFHTYALAFYGIQPLFARDKTGYYHNPGMNLAFDRLWKRHQAWSHHWQAHVLIEDSGKVRAMPMPTIAILEMLADWTGAGRAQGKPNIREWYLTNGSRMTIHSKTRGFIENYLQITPLDKQRFIDQQNRERTEEAIFAAFPDNRKQP
jgi:hypothetical protein